MIHLGDITKLHGYEIPPVDCITGGSPCQDLSVAGKRAGLEGERSGLFMEQIRIVKEMRERDRRAGRTAWAVRPRFMVWENVPGAFSSNKGEDFKAVLEEIVKIAEPDAPPVPLPDKGKWPKAGCLYSDVGDWSVAWRVHDAQFWGVPQRRKRIALVADFAGLAAPEVCFVRAGLSRDPESRGAEGQGTAAAAQGSSGGASISFQERSGKPGGGKGILIQRERTGALSTLNPGAHPGSYNGQDAYNDMLITGCYQNTGRGWWNESDVGATIRTPCGGDSTKANLVTAVDCRNGTENPDVNGTLQAKEQGQNLNSNNVCRINQTVRRLTPLECERLQGFPDGWTDIGDWVDSKGKKHKAADSPRYKALGNSIALPFWFYLLRRISAQYERPAALGSLFDGIGGFPLCWERCNGKGTAIWASEIEEFPIAVTKVHFPEEEHHGEL